MIEEELEKAGHETQIARGDQGIEVVFLDPNPAWGLLLLGAVIADRAMYGRRTFQTKVIDGARHFIFEDEESAQRVLEFLSILSPVNDKKLDTNDEEQRPKID